MHAIGIHSGFRYPQRMPNPPPNSVGAGVRAPRKRDWSQYPNRIAEIAHGRGLAYADLADKVGTHYTTIAKLATGKQELTFDWMKKLAAALNVRAAEIIEPPLTHMRLIKVRGALQAGHWTDYPEWPEDDWYDAAFPDLEELQRLTLYGAEVRGESMNRVFPDRSIVALSYMHGAGPRDLEPGRRYHVRRTKDDGTVEETLKKLVRDEQGELWLTPESNDPHYQEWLPIGMPGETIEIIGRVRLSISPAV